CSTHTPCLHDALPISFCTGTAGCLFESGTLEYGLHTFQVVLLVKAPSNLLRGQKFSHTLVLFDEFPEWHLRFPRLHGFPLYKVIRLFTHKAFIYECEQDLLSVHPAECPVDVGFHITYEYCQVPDDIRKPVEHIVQCKGDVRQHDALGGGM